MMVYGWEFTNEYKRINYNYSRLPFLVNYICLLFHFSALDFETEDTLFRAHDPPFSPILRNINLQNMFTSPIVIYSAKLSSKAQEIFTVSEIKDFDVFRNNVILWLSWEKKHLWQKFLKFELIYIIGKTIE